ncbi:hypothetical protein SAMN04487981_1019 [Streptomyces sp. cf386]|nr:hypothetical protein SAMN04487981_1019 [Streptomyces sp. cf386]
MDEIRRLELECVRWDQATDPDSGETYRVCLLHIPANKTTAAFSKPVDPIVGELIDARNVRTIQVLIDRESILTGAAASGEQPWKYYALGEGYCSYDFFAKCPHRLACARCPFYVPKTSSRGQLLAVKDGIEELARYSPSWPRTGSPRALRDHRTVVDHRPADAPEQPGPPAETTPTARPEPDAPPTPSQRPA